MKYFFNILEQCISQITSNKSNYFFLISILTITSTIVGFFLMLDYNIKLNFLNKNAAEEIIIVSWDKKHHKFVEKELSKIKNKFSLKKIKIISPTKALKILIQSSPIDLNIEEKNNANPLPYTAVIYVNLDKKEFQKLSHEIKKIPNIKNIILDTKKLDIISSIAANYKYCLYLIIGSLFLLTLFLSSTYFIILKLTNQKRLKILYLVGASPAFIIFPFIINATLCGFLGSISGIFILKLIQLYLNKVFFVPPLWIKINFLTINAIIILTTFITIISITGSYIAIKKAYHINP